MVVIVDELCIALAQVPAVLGRVQVEGSVLEGAPEAPHQRPSNRAILRSHTGCQALR